MNTKIATLTFFITYIKYAKKKEKTKKKKKNVPFHLISVYIIYHKAIDLKLNFDVSVISTIV
jgi:hypothetical protein